MIKTLITGSFEETRDMGESWAQKLTGGSVLALYGNLGSGKTTFVQGLARGLGITGNIISPTFIIVRKYEIKSTIKDLKIKNFYHIDLYRIEDARELESLGLDEILNDTENIVAIEWPEKIEDSLPMSRINIKFQYLEDDKRRIEIND